MNATETVAPTEESAAARWVAAFAEGWANPRDADSFADHFEHWLDPGVRMIQPQAPTVVGHEAFRERFARPLFELVPDLRGTVIDWAARGDKLIVELRLEGTVGRRRFEMTTCDKLTLRDGLAVERIAILDPIPLLRAVALSPSAWPRFIREQLRIRRRSP